jgi:hypothetical protein
MILPEQLTLLFTEYNMVTYNLVDSYVYDCDVYSMEIQVKENLYV